MREKPKVLTDGDWNAIIAFENAAQDAIDKGDIERVMMLYSKARYPVSALAVYEQRYQANEGGGENDCGSEG